MSVDWVLDGFGDRTLDVKATDSIDQLAREATIVVDDPNGTAVSEFSFGDQVLLLRDGSSEWIGIKTGDQEKRDAYELQANSYDYYLKRTVTAEYTDTLISAIIEDLISRTPIKWDASSVDVQADRKIDFELRGESIKSGLESLSRLSAGEDFGVTNFPTVNVFFFQPPGAQQAPFDFTEGNYISAEFGNDDRKEVNRVTVYYGEGQNRDKVTVDDQQAIDNLSDSTVYEGSAILELSKYFPQISTEAVAVERANALLDQFSSVQYGTIETVGGFNLEAGQEIFVEDSRNGISGDFRIIEIEYEWQKDTTTVRVAEAVDGVLSTVSRTAEETRRAEHQGIADPTEGAESLSPTRASSAQRNPTPIKPVDLSDGATEDFLEFVADGREIDLSAAGVLPDPPSGTDPALSAEVRTPDEFGSGLAAIGAVSPTGEQVSVQTDTVDTGEVVLFDGQNVVLDRVPANASAWESTDSVDGADVAGVRVVGESSSTTGETISVNDAADGSGSTTTTTVDVNQESVLHETRGKWTEDVDSGLVRRVGPLNVRFLVRNDTGGPVTAGARWVYALKRGIVGDYPRLRWEGA